MGSASELEYFCLLSFELGYLAPTDNQDLVGLVVELKRMLAAFIGKVQNDVRQYG